MNVYKHPYYFKTTSSAKSTYVSYIFIFSVPALCNVNSVHGFDDNSFILVPSDANDIPAFKSTVLFLK